MKNNFLTSPSSSSPPPPSHSSIQLKIRKPIKKTEKQQNNEEKPKVQRTGRPKKASERLRTLEENIKKKSWELTELEEFLFVEKGGVQAEYNSRRRQDTIQLIKASFGVEESDLFEKILTSYKTQMNTLQDPLDFKYNPATIEYELDRLTNNNEKEMTFKQFLIPFAHFIYHRTDQKNFEQLLALLRSICIAAENKNKVTNQNNEQVYSLLPTLKDIQNEATHLEINKLSTLLELLYKVITSIYNTFKDYIVIENTVFMENKMDSGVDYNYYVNNQFSYQNINNHQFSSQNINNDIYL